MRPWILLSSILGIGFGVALGMFSSHWVIFLAVPIGIGTLGYLFTTFSTTKLEKQLDEEVADISDVSIDRESLSTLEETALNVADMEREIRKQIKMRRLMLIVTVSFSLCALAAAIATRGALSIL